MIRDQRFLAAFALLWTIMGMAYVACITFFPITDSGKPFANLVLGFLIGTAFSGILSWAFDGSYNQTKKDGAVIDPVAIPIPAAAPATLMESKT